MNINDDHMYHGAALTQLAEHRKFTAINAVRKAGTASRSSFIINNDTGVYIKYATQPNSAYEEYGFTFAKEHLKEINKLAKKFAKVYIVLVCVQDREICCISNSELQQFIDLRKRAKGGIEPVYTLLVTAPVGKGLRVYVNDPESRGKAVGKKIVARNRFPSVIFE